MSYHRVIPRDLFNEAKLLKCLGQLALLAHDGCGIPIRVESDGEPFELIQDMCDGSLSVTNVEVYIGDRRIFVNTPYNCKDSYPLILDLEWDRIGVFNEKGKLTKEFIEAAKNILEGKIEAES